MSIDTSTRRRRAHATALWCLRWSDTRGLDSACRSCMCARVASRSRLAAEWTASRKACLRVRSLIVGRPTGAPTAATAAKNSAWLLAKGAARHGHAEMVAYSLVHVSSRSDLARLSAESSRFCVLRALYFSSARINSESFLAMAASCAALGLHRTTQRSIRSVDLGSDSRERIETCRGTHAERPSPAHLSAPRPRLRARVPAPCAPSTRPSPKPSNSRYSFGSARGCGAVCVCGNG